MSEDDDEWNDFAPTDPFRTLDPEQRLALHGEPTGDDLVAAVLADPDSDEPRLVYGDWLLERGDPRGELIQLQLQPDHDDARRHRERELLAAHVAEWCAPLYPALRPETIEFRRGFLWRCTTSDRTMALRDVIGHPMWRTVGALDSTEQALVANTCLASLRSLRTQTESLAAMSSAEHPVPLEHVELIGTGPFREYGTQPWAADPEERDWRRIHDVGALTSLRSLAMWQTLDPNTRQTRELLASPLGLQLHTLAFWMVGGNLEAWDHAMREHGSLQRLVIHAGDQRAYRPVRDRGAAVLERTSDGELRAVLEVDRELRLSAVIATLATLPEHFRAVEIVELGTPIDDAALEVLTRRLRHRFPDVTVRR